MTITELGDLLRANPVAWQQIPEPLQQVAKAALLPDPGFTADQRHWFARWWLACTQADVDAVNATLPPATRAEPVNIGGQLYLGGDVLTDALVPGSTYHPALGVLQGLVCTYVEPDAP